MRTQFFLRFEKARGTDPGSERKSVERRNHEKDLKQKGTAEQAERGANAKHRVCVDRNIKTSSLHTKHRKKPKKMNHTKPARSWWALSLSLSCSSSYSCPCS